MPFYLLLPEEFLQCDGSPNHGRPRASSVYYYDIYIASLPVKRQGGIITVAHVAGNVTLHRGETATSMFFPISG